MNPKQKPRNYGLPRAGQGPMQIPPPGVLSNSGHYFDQTLYQLVKGPLYLTPDIKLTDHKE